MPNDNGGWLNKPAPDFQLNDSDGRRHTLADYRGRWLLLTFHRHIG